MRYAWLFIIPILALIAIVSLSLYRFHTQRHATKKVIMIAHSKKIRNLPEYEKVRTRYRILLVLMILFFIVSLSSITLLSSRPISVSVLEPEYETRDIMLCIDVSGSTDNSREELLDYLSEVVGGLKGQRVGISIFAAKATVLAPLSDDYASLQSSLEMLRSSFYFDGKQRVSFYTQAVGGMSNIGSGVVNCINNFDHLQDEEKSLSMIIATDNIQNFGTITIEKAANYAARYGIALYGIDTSYENEGSNLSSNSAKYKNAMLATGGSYYSISSSRLPASEIVDEILKQEAVRHEGERKYIYADSPSITAIIATISTILFLIIVWRIKL